MTRSLYMMGLVCVRVVWDFETIRCSRKLFLSKRTKYNNQLVAIENDKCKKKTADYDSMVYWTVGKQHFECCLSQIKVLHGAWRQWCETRGNFHAVNGNWVLKTDGANMRSSLEGDLLQAAKNKDNKYRLLLATLRYRSHTARVFAAR